jgi:hypothetical protein
MEEAPYRELPLSAEREEPFRKSPRLLNELQAIVAALKLPRISGGLDIRSPLRIKGEP